MSRKRYAPELIMGLLREAGVPWPRGMAIGTDFGTMPVKDFDRSLSSINFAGRWGK